MVAEMKDRRLYPGPQRSAKSSSLDSVASLVTQVLVMQACDRYRKLSHSLELPQVLTVT